MAHTAPYSFTLFLFIYNQDIKLKLLLFMSISSELRREAILEDVHDCEWCDGSSTASVRVILQAESPES